jgi:hypothetical protein
MLRTCLSCMLLFVEWPQAASPLSRFLQPAPHDPLVRSVFVSHNNKGRQRVYIDSHYLDNIDNNVVAINAYLHSHSEHIKIAQMLVIQKAVTTTDNDCSVQPADILDDMRVRFMINGTRSPLSWASRLRLYGKKVRDSTTCLGYIS